MTVAIKRKNGDLIWLDAVLSYDRTYSSQISKHPIEDGSVVTDNVTKDNSRFSLSGVITNADFNTTRPVISSAEAKAYELSDRQIYNSQPVQGSKSGVADNGVEYVQEGGPVIGGGASPLLKFLPETVTQFIEGQPPSVEVPDQQRPDWVYEVEDILVDIQRNHELVSILEFNGSVIEIVYNDCYVGNLTVREDVDTGDAINVSMDIEQVTFVTLVETTLSQDVVDSLKNKTTKKVNKGSVQGDKAEAEVSDAKSGETDLSDKSSEDSSLLKDARSTLSKYIDSGQNLVKRILN